MYLWRAGAYDRRSSTDVRFPVVESVKMHPDLGFLVKLRPSMLAISGNFDCKGVPKYVYLRNVKDFVYLNDKFDLNKEAMESFVMKYMFFLLKDDVTLNRFFNTTTSEKEKIELVQTSAAKNVLERYRYVYLKWKTLPTLQDL